MEKEGVVKSYALFTDIAISSLTVGGIPIDVGGNGGGGGAAASTGFGGAARGRADFILLAMTVAGLLSAKGRREKTASRP